MAVGSLVIPTRGMSGPGGAQVLGLLYRMNNLRGSKAMKWFLYRMFNLRETKAEFSLIPYSY